MLVYLLPLLAVIIGVCFALFLQEKSKLSSQLLLSFSGAFLLALTLFDLLPEVYESLSAKQTGLYIMFGILIQITLEFFSKGAEHGHVHHSDNMTSFPWLLFVSLCIHSLLEGFPISQGNSMVYGVLIHKIPVAAVLGSFLIKSKCSKREVFLFLTLFAFMTPLGTYMANYLHLFEEILPYINALVIGIFLHISTIILFESDKGHSFNLSKLVSILLGIAIAYFI
ncbi:Zinc transporter ZupT [Flavobacteriaceae bacterium MAR_2010_188]|nr:Zinc transporter ZupT [Flavobacteriaceae bacterium MAR_2010_188]